MKILDKEFKYTNFQKSIKVLNQEYFKESENLKNFLKSFKKELSKEDSKQISLILDISEKNTQNFLNFLDNKNQPKTESSERIDLFSTIDSKGNNLELEISDFIGNLNNNEIIKQYYIVENIKSKINNLYNENFEDTKIKQDNLNSYKKYDLIYQNYDINKNKILKDYFTNYKVKYFFNKRKLI